MSVLVAAASVVGMPLAPKAAALSVLQSTLISASPSGEPGDLFSSGKPYMTPDGRFIAFTSNAKNLTSDSLPPLASYPQVFVYDTVQHTMQLVSRDPLGGIGNNTSVVQGISGDGSKVVFETFATNIGSGPGEYVRDVQAGTTVPLGNNTTGATVGFVNNGNLVFAKGAVYDLTTGASATAPAPMVATDVSDDGRYFVAYDSSDPINIKTYRYDRLTDTSVQLHGNRVSHLAITGDGNTTIYIGEDNASIYYEDHTTGQTRKVFATSDVTTQPDASMWFFGDVSYDGRVLAQSVRTTDVNRTIKRMWLVDTQTNKRVVIGGNATGINVYVSLSPDGFDAAVSDETSAFDSKAQIYKRHIGPDTQAPIAGTPTWENNPKPAAGEAGVYLPVTDNVGVIGGEYYQGDTDPGQGNGTPMGYNLGTIYAGIGADIQTPGTYKFTFRAVDADGNWSNTVTDYLVVQTSDTTAPTLGTFDWGTTNPKPLTATAALSVPASDDSSGINRAEYFVGATDPGEGNGTPMNLTSQQTNASNAVIAANLTATFGTNLAAGPYDINVRVQDNAGNWSAVAAGTLIVFDAAGPMDFTSSKQVVPVFNSDKLPGLVAANQNDKADLSFDAFFTATGTVDPASYLTLDYSTGNGCNPAKHPEKCDSITHFTATTITLLSLSGTQNSAGSFQGTGTLTINGTVTTNPFRVSGIDGDRLTPKVNDNVTLNIYAPGTTPTAATTPLYRLSTTGSGSWVKIN